MGASCSSRSASSAVVTGTTTATDRDSRHSIDDGPSPAASRGSSPSPFYRYLAELDANGQSLDFSTRRNRWRRGASGMHRRSHTPDEERQRRTEIENLQRSLAAMEEFFQSLLGQAQLYMEAMDPAGGAGGGPPPASEAELQKLPRVVLTCREMENENNRTCGICCESHAAGDEVTRMPCGHVYHGTCIEAWLSRHCTCPVCRYELPTDDANYEPGRLERMAVRKATPNEVSQEEVTDEKPKATVLHCDDELNEELGS